MWEVIDTGARSASENMVIDEAMLHSLEKSHDPFIHFYEWSSPSVTYGHFIKPEDLLDLKEVAAKGFELAKRPTGGGIIFHVWDFAFSVLIPASFPLYSLNTLENYAYINRIVLEVVKEFLLTKNESLELVQNEAKAFDSKCDCFCMARPTKYDVVLKGRKVAGAAQRRTRFGFLHQGSIALMIPPDESLDGILKKGTRVFEAMKAHTYPLLEEIGGIKKIDTARKLLRQLLIKHFNALSIIDLFRN